VGYRIKEVKVTVHPKIGHEDPEEE